MMTDEKRVAMWSELRDGLLAAHNRIDTLAECLLKMGCKPDGVLSPNPLPAPALTEQAIVDALKADPGMAGRVMAMWAVEIPRNHLPDIRSAADQWMGGIVPNGAALQSLAVALAAASYRG